MRRASETCVDTVLLSWRLFVSTLGAKYRKSFLGYFWLVVPAALITGGVSLASQSGVINPGETRLPYFLFVLIGTLIWQVFVEAVEVPYQAFEGARSYLTRVCFAREAVVLAQIYESLLNTFVRVVVVLALIAMWGDVGGRGVVLMVICFGGAGLLGLGIGAILTPFMLLLADLHNAIKLFLSYGLFLTPAFYIPDQIGLFSMLVRWSPISPLMTSARDAAAGIVLSQPDGLIWVVGSSFVLASLGMGLIRLSAPIVIERMLLGGR